MTPDVEVLENPMIGTRSVFDWCDKVVVHCRSCLLQMTRGVLWHDTRWNCPTWTDATECRCDVDSAS